ncbi:MAG TPA: hypothetical protein PK629_08460 [Oscillospiraceae bacterium]|nr:hypothetical protein [Oscillospiraceae bacterium]HPF56162.1 hypothetical protein [Clostridiales bacterium]HPK35591.1 hypothetical protein [Oscillospiraceae bacterium]HPR75872.1 hypothetical protein [Oscillospiraceae bacterium]
MTIEKNPTVANDVIWQIRVPIFKDPLILKQLGLAIGIPFGILLLILFIAKAWYGLLIVAATLALAFLLVFLIFRGTYDVEYSIDVKGIECKNQEKQQARVKKLSAATFWLGLFSGNPTAAGAGMLGGARTDIKVPWKRIRKVKFNDRRKTVMIFAGFGENIALFCTEENYESVKQIIISKTNIKNH